MVTAILTVNQGKVYFLFGNTVMVYIKSATNGIIANHPLISITLILKIQTNSLVFICVRIITAFYENFKHHMFHEFLSIKQICSRGWRSCKNSAETEVIIRN